MREKHGINWHHPPIIYFTISSICHTCQNATAFASMVRITQAIIPPFHSQLKMALYCSERPTRVLPRLSSLQGCPWNSANSFLAEKCQCLSSGTQIVPNLRGWNVGCFLSQLLFPSGSQSCYALACPCSENSKPLCTSALPSCRPDVISAVLASLSAHSFPLTPAYPGQ